MIDRINFLKSIDQKEREFASTIVTFFDQFMVLYSLIGSYDNVNVSNETNESAVSFNVNLDNKSVMDQLLSAIASCGNQLVIYEKIFRIYPEPITDSSVRIVIC